MSKLEDLVPPLELCNLIPEGAFADSALIWHVQGSPIGYMKELERRDELHAERFGVVLPAPTLAEIMDDQSYRLDISFKLLRFMQKWEIWIFNNCSPKYDWVEMCQRDSDNPATAALKLWLELNERQKENA